MKYLRTLLIICGFISARAQEVPPVYQVLEKNYEVSAFEACVQMAKQVESFTSHRVDTLAANSFFYLGDAFHQLGETDKAISYFEREKKILYALGLRATEDYSYSLNNLAYLYLLQGNYGRAGSTADELLENDRKLFSPNDRLFVESVVDIAGIYIQLDRLRHAESVLLNTLKAQTKASVNRALVLNKLGELYAYTGEYTKATGMLMEAIDVHADELGEGSAEYLSTAINLGILYMAQGKYPEAEEIFEVALSQLDPSESAYAGVLNNQALVYQSLGQLERARKTLYDIKQIDSVQLGTMHPDYAITLSNLGLVYADLKNFAEAEGSLTTALNIQKENSEGQTLSYARKLNNLAKVFQMAGSPERSTPLLEEALSIFRRTVGKTSPEYATAAYNLGLAYWKSGKGETGYKYLKVSADIRRKVLGKNHPKYAESILKLGEYQWNKKSTKDARQSFSEVFQNYYFQIDQTFPVLTEEERSRFYYTNIRGAFDKFNSFALLHREEESGLISDVYNHLINTKAAIMYATEKVKASIMTSGDSALIQQFDLWQASKEQVAKLYSLNQESQQLDSLLEISTSLEKSLARQSSVFQGHMIRERIHWRDIRTSLKQGEAAVEVLRFRNYTPEDGGQFTNDVRYAFLVLTADMTNQPAVIVLNDGNEMESKYLKNYRNSIQYKLSDGYSYQYYFQPLAEFLKKRNVSTVYFSPDGVYNQINVNSIENPDTKKYLIDELDIRFVTNTRELLETGGGHQNSQSPVLIGYPKYNLDTTEVDRQKLHQSITRGRGLNRTWRGGLLRYMRGDGGITQLPGTQVEIEKIAALFGEGSMVYTAGQASERTAKNVDNPSILHVATHGYFLQDQTADQNQSSVYVASPLLNAGLILAGAENFLNTGEPLNEAGDDGILTAFEAMNLKLDKTDLVVLSACETALGDLKNGEGVYGLQRAFKLAGARNIVMSLWNVDDEATQELMTTFYAEMLRTGDRHEAFRTAQQKVKQKYPSPFYWAAFIMTGI